MIIDIRKYNLIRQALAQSTTSKEEVEIVHVPPKDLAIRRTHEPEVLAAAMEILNDPKVMTGITPKDVIDSFHEDRPGVELALYVLTCFAVALQQQWITYSIILHKYVLDHSNREMVEYVEDTHRMYTQ